MKIFCKITAFLGLIMFLPAQGLADTACPDFTQQGSAIFYHPDGMGLNSWGALRLFLSGGTQPLAWDGLPAQSVYVGTLRDNLTGTSHGGATTHAYGIKVAANSFGMDADKPLISASGFNGSIVEEAIEKGFQVALVQSGNITEPGTAAFVASVPNRQMHAEIALQVMESKATIILSGGETWLLPAGVEGQFGKGQREDGRDLISEAKASGYYVVYTKDGLRKIPEGVKRVLGVFATNHSFNDKPEAELQKLGLPLYSPTAPSIAEMMDAALSFLLRSEKPFLMIAEEEGTDNFSNVNNAAGFLEAAQRADEGVAKLRDFIAQNPNVFMLMAADSEAGGLLIDTTGLEEKAAAEKKTWRKIC